MVCVTVDRGQPKYLSPRFDCRRETDTAPGWAEKHTNKSFGDPSVAASDLEEPFAQLLLSGVALPFRFNLGRWWQTSHRFIHATPGNPETALPRLANGARRGAATIESGAECKQRLRRHADRNLVARQHLDRARGHVSHHQAPVRRNVLDDGIVVSLVVHLQLACRVARVQQRPPRAT